MRRDAAGRYPAIVLDLRGRLPISVGMVSEHRRRRIVAFLLVIGAISCPAEQLLVRPRWDSIPAYVNPPTADVRAVLLYEVGTRTILYARNERLATPPASITKVFAIDAAMRAIEAGETSLEAEIVPPAPSWWSNVPPDSSLMFLGPDQVLTVRELLIGLAVPSGNDAAVALALHLDGSVSGFASRINELLRSEGINGATFVEPSGLSPQNLVTAEALAEFTYRHLRRFPGLTEWLYDTQEFTYPKPHNITGSRGAEPIMQSNRNGMLAGYRGADGLKTGYTEEAGYSLVATAERDGRRLVAIVLGVEAPDSFTGAARREQIAAALLDYGFGAFSIREATPPQLPQVRVLGGSPARIAAVPAEPIIASVPDESMQLTGRIEVHKSLTAPVAPGAVLGSVYLESEGVTLREVPLITQSGAEQGGVIRRLWDAIVGFFLSLSGEGGATDGESLQQIDPVLLLP